MGRPYLVLVVKTIEWLKERWFDFRNGHNVYGAMVLQFINFILLVKVAFGLSSFLVAFLLLTTYLPLMIAVGFYYHRKRQLETDQNATFKQSTLMAKVFRCTFFGTEAEKEWAKKVLFDIERSGSPVA